MLAGIATLCRQDRRHHTASFLPASTRGPSTECLLADPHEIAALEPRDVPSVRLSSWSADASSNMKVDVGMMMRFTGFVFSALTVLAILLS
jgi:hypothetical protein